MNGFGIFIFIFFALATLAFYALIDSVPPHKITLTTLNTLKDRISHYAHIHGHLPHNLNDLPTLPDRHNAIFDAWGNAIDYSFTADNYEVILVSYGKDQQLGGIGRNTDLIGRFHPIDKQGEFTQTTVSWAQDPADFAPTYNTGYQNGQKSGMTIITPPWLLCNSDNNGMSTVPFSAGETSSLSKIPLLTRYQPRMPTDSELEAISKLDDYDPQAITFVYTVDTDSYDHIG